jgi:O-antigen ligase
LTSPSVHQIDLEPSLVSQGTYLSRLRRYHFDAATALCLMIILLYFIPAGQIIPGLTDIGRPAVLASILLAVWWFIGKLSPRLVMTGMQPLRWAALFFLLSSMISYAAGYLRGLPSIEANSADMTMLGTAGLLGVIVMTADGISSRARLDRVLYVYVTCAGVMAFVGVLQFLIQDDITKYLTIPGLQQKRLQVGFEGRGDGGLFRVASTATHYIEFSAVMAITLPYALHLARFAPTRKQRQVAAIAGLLVASAIPLTVSRTGVLAAGLVVLAMIPAWNWRMRFNIIALMLVGVAAFVVVRPGLLGTIKSLFLSFESDPSIAGRTDDYPVIMQYFSERPWFGRGTGTFVPIVYQILDNQWLGQLVTMGVVGAAAFAALHITALSLATIALRRTANPVDRHLCAALISTQIAAMVCATTFDSFGFDTFALTWAMLTGVCGVMWRLTHPDTAVRQATAGQERDPVATPRDRLPSPAPRKEINA